MKSIILIFALFLTFLQNQVLASGPLSKIPTRLLCKNFEGSADEFVDKHKVIVAGDVVRLGFGYQEKLVIKELLKLPAVENHSRQIKSANSFSLTGFSDESDKIIIGMDTFQGLDLHRDGVKCFPVSRKNELSVSEFKDKSYLYSYVKKEQFDAAEKEIKKGKIARPDGKTDFEALELLIKKERKELILLFLGAMKDINERDDHGSNILFYLARKEMPEVIQQAITKGADPNIKNKMNATPLSVSAALWSFENFKLLLSKKELDLNEDWSAVI